MMINVQIGNTKINIKMFQIYPINVSLLLMSIHYSKNIVSLAYYFKTINFDNIYNDVI